MGIFASSGCGYGATVPIGILDRKKISFQIKFCNWADVFQSPNFINTRALAANQLMTIQDLAYAEQALFSEVRAIYLYPASTDSLERLEKIHTEYRNVSVPKIRQLEIRESL